MKRSRGLKALSLVGTPPAGLASSSSSPLTYIKVHVVSMEQSAPKLPLIWRRQAGLADQACTLGDTSSKTVVENIPAFTPTPRALPVKARL